MSAFRAEIDQGLERLKQITPAGETYMHEGMKAVSMNEKLRCSLGSNSKPKSTVLLSLSLSLCQVSDQMKAQTSPSSSIIIVLTDGKLEVYPYELSVQEVGRLQSDLEPVSMVQTVVAVVVLPRLTKSGALEPESTA